MMQTSRQAERIDNVSTLQNTSANWTRASAEQLAAALEMVPTAVGVVDRNGIVVTFNSEMKKYMPTGVMPSGDPARVGRWSAFRADGTRVEPNDFPIARALAGDARAELDMLYTDDNGRTIWTRRAAVPIRNQAGEVIGAIATVTDIDALKRSEMALREREEQLIAQIAKTQVLQDLGDRLVPEYDPESLYQIIADAAAEVMQSDAASIQEYHPESEKLELRASRGLHPESAAYWKWVGAETSTACGVALREGRPVAIADVMEKFRDDADALNAFRLSGVRSVQSTPLVYHGRVLGMLSTQWSRPDEAEAHDFRAFNILARWAAALMDRNRSESALRNSEGQQKVLIAELQHRTRNLLAVVQALARESADTAASVDDFTGVFGRRLSALARVQGLLSRAHREPITIDALARMELEALGNDGLQDRIHLSGPDVELRPSTVQTIALALHELATNALKHGSLGSGRGSLDVNWSLQNGRQNHLLLEWREQGLELSPEQCSAAHRGYGRELIEHALPYSLGAKTSFELQPSGVFCSIDLPLDGLQA